jgi:hypothetical protein
MVGHDKVQRLRFDTGLLRIFLLFFLSCILDPFYFAFALIYTTHPTELVMYYIEHIHDTRSVIVDAVEYSCSPKLLAYHLPLSFLSCLFSLALFILRTQTSIPASLSCTHPLTFFCSAALSRARRSSAAFFFSAALFSSAYSIR